MSMIVYLHMSTHIDMSLLTSFRHLSALNSQNAPRNALNLSKGRPKRRWCTFHRRFCCCRRLANQNLPPPIIQNMTWQSFTAASTSRHWRWDMTQNWWWRIWWCSSIPQLTIPYWLPPVQFSTSSTAGFHTCGCLPSPPTSTIIAGSTWSISWQHDLESVCNYIHIRYDISWIDWICLNLCWL